MIKPKIPPVLHHKESIWCPHCGEEFGIESKVEYERQYGIDYCYKEMLRQFNKLLDKVARSPFQYFKPTWDRETREYDGGIETREEWQALQSQLEKA